MLFFNPFFYDRIKTLVYYCMSMTKKEDIIFVQKLLRKPQIPFQFWKNDFQYEAYLLCLYKQHFIPVTVAEEQAHDWYMCKTETYARLWRSETPSSINVNKNNNQSIRNGKKWYQLNLWEMLNNICKTHKK